MRRIHNFPLQPQNTSVLGTVRGRQIYCQENQRPSDHTTLFAFKVDYLISLILRRQAQEITRLFTPSLPFDQERLEFSQKSLTATEQAYFSRLKKECLEKIEHDPILLALVLLNDAATNSTTQESAAEVVTALLENTQRLREYTNTVKLTCASTTEIQSFAKGLNENVQSVVTAFLPIASDVEQHTDPSLQA